MGFLQCGDSQQTNTSIRCQDVISTTERKEGKRLGNCGWVLFSEVGGDGVREGHSGRSLVNRDLEAKMWTSAGRALQTVGTAKESPRDGYVLGGCGE